MNEEKFCDVVSWVSFGSAVVCCLIACVCAILGADESTVYLWQGLVLVSFFMMAKAEAGQYRCLYFELLKKIREES